MKIPAMIFVFCELSLAVGQIRIPAHSAYTDPVQARVRVVPEKGIQGWNSANVRILWIGKFKHTGDVQAAVEVRLPEKARTQLALEIDGETQSVEVVGTGKPQRVFPGAFEIRRAGYHKITLSRNDVGKSPEIDVLALELKGAAVADAHFNTDARRNAASVHLMYPVQKGTRVAAFYCELTGLEDPLWTYYMACGWHRGYFGMQVNSPSERRIIFSVWDSGNEAVDRRRVAAEDRVVLVEKGEGVYAGGFGNEGTGGHSHLKYNWKTGERQKFLVTATPVDSSHTEYAGYFFRTDQKQWMLISSWKAPHDGGYLRGLYSFSENFSGRNGHLYRKALFGNQWIRTADGRWVELTRARFSHDVTGRAHRLDRAMGLEDGQFFLSHGGFRDEPTDYGAVFERPATGRRPDIPDVLSPVAD